jgi:hypothetical protein
MVIVIGTVAAFAGGGDAMLNTTSSMKSSPARIKLFKFRRNGEIFIVCISTSIVFVKSVSYVSLQFI